MAAPIVIGRIREVNEKRQYVFADYTVSGTVHDVICDMRRKRVVIDNLSVPDLTTVHSEVLPKAGQWAAMRIYHRNRGWKSYSWGVRQPADWFTGLLRSGRIDSYAGGKATIHEPGSHQVVSGILKGGVVTPSRRLAICLSEAEISNRRDVCPASDNGEFTAVFDLSSAGIEMIPHTGEMVLVVVEGLVTRRLKFKLPVPELTSPELAEAVLM